MRALPIALAALGVVVAVGTRAGQGRDVPEVHAAWAEAGGYEALLPALPGDSRADREFTEALTAVVRQYCVVCHSDQLRTGNLSLEAFDVAEVVLHAETAEKMIHKLRLEMMPPPGMPRPSGDTLQLLATALESELDRAAAATSRPGIRRFQRLTAGEYERAIGELLGLDVDAAQWLPPDVFLGSYDTWSDLQGLSALIVEAYLAAASEVSRMAVGNPRAVSTSTTYPVHIEASQHMWDHVEGTPYGTRGGTVVMHNFPADGEYVFSVATRLGTGHESEDLDISVDGEPVALLALPHGSGGGVPLETEPVFIRAGQRQVSAAFVRRSDGPYQDFLSPHGFSFVGGERNTSWADYGITNLRHLTAVTVTGPIEPTGVSGSPSRQRVFVCDPATPEEERLCAERIIARLATQAYRRPATEEDLAPLLSFYERARAEADFDAGIRTALQGVLSSPAFLFRLEEEPPGLLAGQSYVLSDVDLASRLSFFLWGTAPDEELLDVAEQGRLTEPAVLEEQVRRMLADRRSEALATRFAAQWFRLEALKGQQPVPFWYPDYSLDLSSAMRRETELFFDYLVRADRSFLELFTADYTFVNERLARHYGIPFTGGSGFQRVRTDDPYRRGILGHGSVLALTSLANRTSPVKRGEWVMEVLLGSPPPPPPPDVPDLDATSEVANGRLLTTRERMEMHRTNPTCNSCHQFIDPIGLALDHFDPTGRVRVRENRIPLDTRGEYYDGTVISTPGELVEVLLRRPEPLLRTFTENLMSFAIGRQLEFTDQPAVRAITRKAAENDYRMSSFILGVVQSDQFRMRQIEASADDGDRDR